MEQNKSSIILLATGGLLVMIGALLTYIFLPPQVVEVRDVESGAMNALTYRWSAPDDYERAPRTYDTLIPLPQPDITGTTPVESVIQSRRSARSFAAESLNLEQVAQMLWAGIGISSEDGKRTAPSPGSAHPTSLFLVAENVDGLASGLYEYIEAEHALGLVRAGSFIADWESITQQPYPMNAPAVALVTGDMYTHYHRFGTASERLVAQESGHIGQNLYLQAESLGLGMIVMGGIDTAAGQEFVGTPVHEPVLYLIPFGIAE